MLSASQCADVKRFGRSLDSLPNQEIHWITVDLYEQLLLNKKGAFALPSFTHWIIIPETPQYYRFAKAVTLSRDGLSETVKRMKDKGIKVLPYSTTSPESLPTRPQYK